MSAEVDDKNDEQQFLTIYTDETCAHGVEVPLESGTLALSINALSIAVHRANGLKFLNPETNRYRVLVPREDGKIYAHNRQWGEHKYVVCYAEAGGVKPKSVAAIHRMAVTKATERKLDEDAFGGQAIPQKMATLYNAYGEFLGYPLRQQQEVNLTPEDAFAYYDQPDDTGNQPLPSLFDRVIDESYIMPPELFDFGPPLMPMGRFSRQAGMGSDFNDDEISSHRRRPAWWTPSRPRWGEAREPQPLFLPGMHAPIMMRQPHVDIIKTIMCKRWAENGTCMLGEHCTYAHGEEELRPIVKKPKRGHEAGEPPVSKPNEIPASSSSVADKPKPEPLITVGGKPLDPKYSHDREGDYGWFTQYLARTRGEEWRLRQKERPQHIRIYNKNFW